MSLTALLQSHHDMNYGTRALGVRVLVLERDETNVSGLAMTFHLLSLIRCCGVRWQQGWGDQGSWHSICFSWWCRRVGLKLVFTLILLGVLLWKIVPLPGCQLAESSAWDSWSWKGGRERRNVCERNVYGCLFSVCACGSHICDFKYSSICTFKK